MANWSITADKSGTYEFKTSGKYVDRDIDLVVPQAAETVSATASVDVTDTIAVGVGTKSSGKYPFTGSKTITKSITGTATATVGTKGFTDSNSYTGSTSGTTSGTVSASGSVNAAAPTVTGSATVKPGTATKNANSNVNTGTIVTSKPSSGYYLGVDSATAASTSITQTKGGTTGYLGDINNELTASGTVTGGTTTTYIPITGGSIGVSSTDPGTSYTANTEAVVPSAGYLTISEGYYPKTKISLATLVPDDVNIGDTKGADTILTGTTVYDKDGTKVTGTMPTSTTSGSNNSATATANASISTSNLASGTYTTSATSGYTYHLDASASSSIADVSASKTVSAGYVSSAVTATATVTGASKTASSNVYLLDSTAKIGTTSIASGETISAGSTLTIGKGYYPTARTFTAQSAGDALDSNDITGTLDITATSSDYNLSGVVPTAPSAPYITISGSGTMSTGSIYSGTANSSTKYIAIYSGTYSIT